METEFYSFIFCWCKYAPISEPDGFRVKDIILDYAAITASRTSIFGMYTQMSIRKHIKHIHLNSMVIGGHYRSIGHKKSESGH